MLNYVNKLLNSRVTCKVPMTLSSHVGHPHIIQYEPRFVQGERKIPLPRVVLGGGSDHRIGNDNSGHGRLMF